MIRVLDSAGSTLVEWGRQQQQHDDDNDDESDDNEDDCMKIISAMIVVLLATPMATIKMKMNGRKTLE